jgi:hypothetical protein
MDAGSLWPSGFAPTSSLRARQAEGFGCAGAKPNTEHE